MFIYLCFGVWAVILFLFLQQHRTSSQINKINILFFFTILTILFAFRDKTVGTDYQNYLYYYNISNIESIFSKPYWFLNDPFWKLLMAVFKTSGVSEVGFSFIFCTINLFIIYKVAIRTNYPLSVCSLFFLCYFYFSGFNIMRQFIAANICLYGITCLDRKHWKSFILCCVIASLFHKTALYVIPFIILYRLSISPQLAFMLILTTVGLVYAGFDTMLFSKLDFSYFSDYYGAGIVNQYSNYLNNSLSGYNIYGLIMYWTLLIFKILLFLVVILNKKEKLSLYEKFWFIGILLTIFTSNYQWLFRVSIYFMITQIIAISIYYSGNNKMNQKSLVIILIFLLFVCNLYNNADGVVPYALYK